VFLETPEFAIIKLLIPLSISLYENFEPVSRNVVFPIAIEY
jgi:hypothetical protein